MKLKDDTGFTLADIIIAMAIISLVTMFFLRLSNKAILFNKKNEVDIVSMNIAQSIIEDLRMDIKNDDTIGLDIENNGVEDNKFRVKDNWIVKDELEVYNDLLITYIYKDNVKYKIFIPRGSLTREKKSNIHKRYIYTIKLHVEPERELKNSISIITQVYKKE